MKLTALKCPSCGGPIELDEKDENIGYCQYCHTKYYMESEQPRVFIEYKQGAPYSNSGMKNENGNKALAAIGAAIGVIAVLAFILAPLSGNTGSMKKQLADMKTAVTTAVPYSYSYQEETETEKEMAVHSSSYDLLIKEALGRSASSVTEEELGRFQYLSVSKSSDGWVIGYSLETAKQPAGSQAENGRKTITCDMPLTVKEIASFPRLEHLSLDHVELEEGSLEPLSSLRTLTCDYIQLDTLRLALGNVSEKLEALYGFHLKSLDELAYFPGLKTLELDDCWEITDLSALAQVKGLENLTLYGIDGVSDFSVLNVMKNLKRLALEAENLRDLGFVSHMPRLSSLEVTGSQILLLDPLLGAESLKELKLEDNGEIRDYSPLGALTGLEALALDKYTSQEDPDLTALTGLKRGEFQGMMGIRFIGSLTGLEELKVQGCNVDQPSVIASLPGLKKLVYRKNWGNSDDLSFLAGCQSLTYLDMNRSEFYGDVSYAFNLPALETLILDKSSFEVRFDRLHDNPSLKALALDGVKLYENIEMWSDGMFRSIDYDDVLLDDCTSFLTYYPSLEYLSLRGNQLTDIQFAADLKNLRVLDISDNYVTDTRVLDQLEYLGKEGTVGPPAAELDWADTVEDSY